MVRTTILLPHSLKVKATTTAKSFGISLDDLIRTALESYCTNRNTNNSDLFFEDKNFYSGEIPSDLSSKHDDYLY